MMTSVILNDKICECLKSLYEIKMFKGDIMRSRIYKKSYDTIMSLNKEITSLDQIKDIKGIGKSTLIKLNEFIETGKNEEVEKEKQTSAYLFTKIHGIGPKKALELSKSNINSIDELKVKVSENPDILNNTQKIGLKYYEDINQRIPRNIIDIYNIIIKKVIENYKNEYKYEIVGSYRRGAMNSGDIDIIITNIKDSKPLDIKLFNNLLKSNIEDLIELSIGLKKSMLLCKIEDDIYYRRIDILYSPPNEFPYSVLYFTGSASFNTLMRKRALELGYTLNEHGISIMKKGVKTDLLDIKVNNELEIFNFLKIVYREPTERQGALSIEYIKETNLELYKKEGYKYLEKLEKENLEQLLLDANNNYYNDKNIILTDEMYDILKEYIEEKYSKSKVLKQIGSSIEYSKQKVKLPYNMGSMNKIKPNTDALDKWKNKYNTDYVLSAKLDGVSGLFMTTSEGMYLYTRGDGTYGQDISYLIPYFIKSGTIPNIKIEEDNVSIVFRGEFIISKNNFNKYFSSSFSNARNFVSGIINSKTVDYKKLSKIEFLPYELVYPTTYKPIDQFTKISKIWKNCSKYNFIENSILTNDYLSNLLIDWRENYEYEIDGIIVTSNEIYKRKIGNPEHSIAFKMVMTDQIVEAKVIDVLWTPSKDGYLKPRVRIEPVNIGGAIIEYATGFNGSFIYENGIGFGSIIQLVRSGDVIPHIMKVIKKVEPKMPEQNYIWSSTKVDIMLSKEDLDINEIVKNKQIVLFLEKLGVVGLGSGNVKRLIDAGFDDIFKILNMKVEDFLTIDGFKEKMSNKLYNSIQECINNRTPIEIICAFGIFGRGISEKKINKILDKYPNYFKDLIINYQNNTLDIEKEKSKIICVEGFASKTALQFINNIDKCIQILIKLNLVSRLETEQKEIVNGKLLNKKIVMSGFRSKELEKKIKEEGGIVSSTITKTTDLLIVKTKDEATSKTIKANQYGINILTIDEFTKYL